MLRITTTRTDESTTARLEGRLAGPWVAELRHWWGSEVAAASSSPLSIDMSELAFVDAEGRELLEEMYRRGVELRACGCMTRAIRDEIVEAAGRQGLLRRSGRPRPPSGTSSGRSDVGPARGTG